MTKIKLLLLYIFCSFGQIYAQVFKVDTLQLNGNTDKFINVVILGDGYTASEQTKFLTNATQLKNYLFSQSPWSNYQTYFNVFAIEVISEESGTRHPNTAPDCSSANVPVSNPNTYLGVTFDYANIHRLVVPTKHANISNVLSKNFPNYDQVLILANTPYYGGSGGFYATATNGTSSFEVAAHELGHSFAFLSDEYYAGDNYAAERDNNTKETNPTKVKWKNWIGFKNVGIYQHCCGGESALWHRPHENCKMRYLGREFCPVCTQSTVKRVHNLVGNTILDYHPKSQEVSFCEQMNFNVSFIKPIPNTLLVKWELNGIQLPGFSDSVSIDQGLLTNNENILIVTVRDTTLLVRDENHNTTYTHQWNIIKKPEIKIIRNGANDICAGDSIILTCPEASEYLWNNGAKTQSIIIFDAGEYFVSTIDKDGCNTTSDTITIEVFPLPEVSFTLPVDTISISELPFTLTGGMPPGGIYTGNGVENGVLLRELLTPGWQTITYTIEDLNHCSNSLTQEVYIDVCSSYTTIEIIRNGANDLCAGDSIILSCPEASEYLWSNGSKTQSIIIFDAGEYFVSTIDKDGCTAISDTILIEVFPLPEVSFTLPVDTLCINELPFTLTGGIPQGGTYTGNGVENGVLLRELVTPGWQTISYTFEDLNHCSNSTIQEVYIDVCTSSTNIENLYEIKIIPNPGSGKFNIVLNDKTDEQWEYTVYNVKGQCLKDIKIQGNEIDMTSQPGGIYFIGIKIKEKTLFKKLVITN